MRYLLPFLLSALSLPAAAEEIRHRFLAKDESRAQVHYVDQVEPAKDWTIKLPAKGRDLQLIGRGRLLVSMPDGYREYQLADQKLVRELHGFRGTESARRLPDGRTILARNIDHGVTLQELSPDTQPLRKAVFPGFATRVVRVTPQDTIFFGSGPNLLEVNLQGETLHNFTLPSGSWVYMALRRPDGHLLVAGGYNPSLFELDAEGRVVRTLGGKQSPDAAKLGFHFFGCLQVLRNGHTIVANWTGHGANDSTKGAQVLELDADGKVVWSWHDAQRAGSIHGVIVLDDLDPTLLNDDRSSVLGPVR